MSGINRLRNALIILAKSHQSLYYSMLCSCTNPEILSGWMDPDKFFSAETQGLNAETNKAFNAHLICAKILRAGLYILTNSIIFLFTYYICTYYLDFFSYYMSHITMLF